MTAQITAPTKTRPPMSHGIIATDPDGRGILTGCGFGIGAIGVGAHAGSTGSRTGAGFESVLAD